MPLFPRSTSFTDYQNNSPSPDSPFLSFNLFGTLGKQYSFSQTGSIINLSSNYVSKSGAIEFVVAPNWQIAVTIVANFTDFAIRNWGYLHSFSSTLNSRINGMREIMNLTLSGGDYVLIDLDKNYKGTYGMKIVIDDNIIIENTDDMNINCSIELSKVQKEQSSAEIDTSILYGAQIDNNVSAGAGTPPSTYDNETYSCTQRSRDDFVWRIQYFLAKKGLYLCTIDGIFGKKTENAVKAWQTLLHTVNPALNFSTDGVWTPELYNASISELVNQTVSVHTLEAYKSMEAENYQNPFREFRLFGSQMSNDLLGFGWDWTHGGGSAKAVDWTKNAQWVTNNQLVLGDHTLLGHNKGGVKIVVNRGWSVKLKIESEVYNYFSDNLSVGVKHHLISSINNIDNDSIIELTLLGGDCLQIENPSITSQFYLTLNGRVVNIENPSTPTSFGSACWISLVDVNPPDEGWVGFGEFDPPNWGDDSGLSFIEKAIKACDHEGMIRSLNSNGDSIGYKMETGIALEMEAHGSIECKVSYATNPDGSIIYELESVRVLGIGEEAGSTKADISFFGFEENSGVSQSVKLDAGWGTKYQFSNVSDVIKGINIIIQSLGAGAASAAVSTISGGLGSLALYALIGPSENDKSFLQSHRAKDKFSLTLGFSAEVGFEANSDLWDGDVGASLKASLGGTGSRSVEFDWQSPMEIGFATESSIVAGFSAQAGLWGSATSAGSANAQIDAKCEYSSTFPISGPVTVGDVCGIMINAISASSPITSLPANLVLPKNVLQVKISGELKVTGITAGGLYEYEFVFTETPSTITAALNGLKTTGFSGMLNAIGQDIQITSFISKTTTVEVGAGIDIKVVGAGVKLGIIAFHKDRPRNHWTYTGNALDTWNNFNSAFASFFEGGVPSE